MPSLSLSSSYLIPAILLNPAFILHLINTFVSHMVPPPHIVSNSPHPVFETLGPLPGSKPYLDMHADDQLCWGYTAVMVFVQVLVFGRVQDNRVQRKRAKAAKIEREKIRKEKLQLLETERKLLEKATKGNGHDCATCMDGVWELLEEDQAHNLKSNGRKNSIRGVKTPSLPETESDASLTETSEEELH